MDDGLRRAAAGSRAGPRFVSPGAGRPARPLLTPYPAKLEIASSSPAETEGIAARLADRLVPGDVVYVAGELGSGKTTFVRGACRALGVTGPVTSPTYTVGHRYDGVSHLDLYRLESVTEDDWAALEPYFDDAIVFVEWPERAAGRLPAPRVSIHLAHVADEERAIELTCVEAGMLDGLL